MIPGHIVQAQALFGQPATHSQWQTKLPSSTQRAVCDFLQSWRNAIGLWIPLHRRTPLHATMENWGWQAREGCMSRLWTWVPMHRKTGQKSDECHSQQADQGAVVRPADCKSNSRALLTNQVKWRSQSSRIVGQCPLGPSYGQFGFWAIPSSPTNSFPNQDKCKLMRASG